MKFGTNKSGSDISLGSLEIEHTQENHHNKKSKPLNLGSPSYKEVNTMNLAITADAQVGLELFDSAIRIAFALKSPGGKKHMHFRIVMNKFPRNKIFLESFEFDLTGILTFPSKQTICHKITCVIAFSVGVGLSGKSMWFNSNNDDIKVRFQ